MAIGSFPVLRIMRGLALDLAAFGRLTLRSRVHLASENLFLRKQLALYLERTARPRRVDPATRATLGLLARLVDWKPILTVVKPDTLVRWHRAGWRLFWRLKSRRRGRPPIPPDLQRLIVAMARANHTWGEERIAAELRVKLGIAVSPRTVRRLYSANITSGPFRRAAAVPDGVPARRGGAASGREDGASARFRWQVWSTSAARPAAVFHVATPLGHPHGDVALADERAIVGGPVRDAVLRLVRGMHSRLLSGRRIRAPTP